MYYRVAIQMGPSPTWEWKSTALRSINTLLHWLQYYRVLPHDRLRIFSSSSLEDLNEQLVQENQGLRSTSVPAAQFLQERMLAPQAVVGAASAGGTQANERIASIGGEGLPSPNESSSPLERRRDELERGAGGDHDLPYEFTLPTSTPQVRAWVKLLVRVRESDLQEVATGVESGKGHPHLIS